MTNSDTLVKQMKDNTGVSIENRSVTLPENLAATESLVSVTQFLLSQGYLNKDDVPIKSGHKRYLINTSPTHQEGDQMARPEEIAEGMFVEKNFSNKQIKQKILQLYDVVNSEQSG